MDSFEDNDNDNELSDNENLLHAEDLFEDDDVDNRNEEDILPAEDEASHEDGGEKGKKNDSKLREKKKRVVRNQRVCLNFQRLKSEYGLPALAKTFENFKFRGKHHEIEDMSCILQNLQHWMCNTLYPGYDFETCLKTLEHIGKKRVVQTHMRKLRREASDNLHKSQENFLGYNEGNISPNEKDVEHVLEERVLSEI